METPILDPEDKQGGKDYGVLMERRSRELEEINKEFLNDERYAKVENLAEKLEKYKAKFLEFDLDASGDINPMSLTLMLEKLGQPKTHVELMEMIREVDTTGTETITYREFLWMMLGTKRCILRLILFFENLE